MLATVNAGPVTAGLSRRLAALAYDALLLIAIYAAVALVLVLATGAIGISLPRLALQLALLAATGLFYGWFWRRGGQTLGMRAWRLRLVTQSGEAVTWRHALLRLTFALLSWACLGLGYLWILVDRDRLAWHDRASGTRPIVLPKGSTKPRA